MTQDSEKKPKKPFYGKKKPQKKTEEEATTSSIQNGENESPADVEVFEDEEIAEDEKEEVLNNLENIIDVFRFWKAGSKWLIRTKKSGSHQSRLKKLLHWMPQSNVNSQSQ